MSLLYDSEQEVVVTMCVGEGGLYQAVGLLIKLNAVTKTLRLNAWKTVKISTNP